MILANLSRKQKLSTLLLMLFLALLFITARLLFFSEYQIEDWQVVNNENIQFKPGFLKPVAKQMQQFDESKIYNVQRYTQELIEVAESKGIPREELIEILEITDKEMPQKPKTLTMIRTMRYKGKDTVLIFYQIGFAKNRIISHLKAKFGRDNHHFLFVVVERGTNKILSSQW